MKNLLSIHINSFLEGREIELMAHDKSNEPWSLFFMTHGGKIFRCDNIRSSMTKLPLDSGGRLTIEWE